MRALPAILIARPSRKLMEKLFTLLDLQRQAQEAPSLAALAHVVVNKTRELIPYDEAIVWTGKGNTLSFEAVSGNAAMDEKGPFAQSLKILLRKEAQAGEAVVRLSTDMLRTHLERSGGNALIALMPGRGHGDAGGLWIYREKKFVPAEEQILTELVRGYGVALTLIQSRPGGGWKTAWQNAGKWKKAALIGFLILAFLPVRQSVSAPVEIVAQNASVISIPFDGIVDDILVQPGDAVEAGQVVARMEQTALRARMDMAQEALSTAQTTLARLRRDALGNPDRRIEMTALQSDIAIKKLEYDYAAALLGRSDLVAQRSGVAIFSDKNMIVGKPAGTGNVIMQIADPAEKELLVRVPVDALIPLSMDSPVSFHLNVSPLHKHRAHIVSMGYQASPDPDGLLTYKIRARLSDANGENRIGWKGTATIKGQWTIMAYAIARRPLAAARRMTGL